MLMPVRTAGSRPPFFIVHGLYGIMPMGPYFARALDPEQPVYAIQARGFDGILPSYHSVAEMAADYIGEIRAVYPTGPYLVGGLCAGSMTAIEIARALMGAGEKVGKVLMIDPPPVPFGHVQTSGKNDPRQNPAVAKILYNHAIEEARKQTLLHPHVPFDPNDPRGMHRAAMVAIACVSTFSHYRPEPFYGATEMIVSSERAIAQFDPRLPWQKALLGPRTVHVLSGLHGDLFEVNLPAVAQLLAFGVEHAFDNAAAPAPGPGDATATGDGRADTHLPAALADNAN